MIKLLPFLCLVGFAMQAQTANFKGTITNDTIGEIVITGVDNDFRQVIPLDKNGNFSSKLNPEPSPGLYGMSYNRMAHYLYLSESTNLTITTKTVYNKPVFKGEGAVENILLQKCRMIFLVFIMIATHIRLNIKGLVRRPKQK
ncbi:hypothetical protein ACLI09_01460 [Flavobacterium sp. RHBU_24]|uniref:hypothetical protein n=1 Tax=Flavobacterium sp. RHBU_24 TaxID=3391185 RepID=UPI003984A0F3